MEDLGVDLIIKEAHRNALYDLINKLNGLTFSQKEPYMNILRNLKPVPEVKQEEKLTQND